MSPTTWAQIIFAAGVIFAAGGAWFRLIRQGQDIKALQEERDYHADSLAKIFRLFRVEPPDRRPR